MNRKIFKSRDNVLIDGVLSGIAEYFNIDPTLVRLAFAFYFIFFSINCVLFYIFAALIMPRKQVIVDELNANFPLKRMSNLRKQVKEKPVEKKPSEEKTVEETEQEEIVDKDEEVGAIYLRPEYIEGEGTGADYEKEIKEIHVPLDQTPPQITTSVIPKT